eukprot:2073110-Amphidinium_carterae.2
MEALCFHLPTRTSVDVDNVRTVAVDANDVVVLVLLSASKVKEVDVDDVLELPPGSEIVEVDVDRGIALPPTSEDIEVDVDEVIIVDVDVDVVLVLILLPVSKVNEVDVQDVLIFPTISVDKLEFMLVDMLGDVVEQIAQTSQKLTTS